MWPHNWQGWRLAVKSVARTHTEIWNSRNEWYIGFDRVELALSNPIVCFFWEWDLGMKRGSVKKTYAFLDGDFNNNVQEMIFNFDEIFSICRAFNSQHFDKKSFRKAFVLMEIYSKYCKQRKIKKIEKTFFMIHFWQKVFYSFSYQNKVKN